VLKDGLNDPWDLVVDSSRQDIYFTNRNGGTVQRIARDKTLSTVASGFDGPSGIARDTAGNLYVADTKHDAIKKMTTSGAIIGTIGSGFKHPYGVAVDSAGDVYVADTGHDAIKKVTPSGRIFTLGSGFSGPTNLAVDASGNVFVADSNHDAIKEIIP
jgi:large repetitive protein